jgi:amino-acid N-acetyltransferase
MSVSKTRANAEEKIIIRQARKEDAAAIHRLLAKYAGEKLLLPRTVREITEHINNFIAAESRGKVVGSCAVRDFGGNLCEIRSLAVSPKEKNKGLGTKLVKRAMMKKRGKNKFFALTYRPNIFIRIGYKIVPKDMFPEKIWNDCAMCPKKNNCDEIAVLFEYTL